MRRLVRTLLVLGTVGGVVVAVLVTTTPVSRDRVLSAYVLYLGALAMIGLVTATRSAGSTSADSLYERALRRRNPQPERPGELSRIEREVEMSATTSFDLHIRLRPLLRTIAAHRLSRRGLDLDTGSPEVRELLGEETWQLVRPDLEPPDDRLALGLPITAQRATLDALEKI